MRNKLLGKDSQFRLKLIDFEECVGLPGETVWEAILSLGWWHHLEAHGWRCQLYAPMKLPRRICYMRTEDKRWNSDKH